MSHKPLTSGFLVRCQFSINTMTILPFSPELATELAQREQFLETTRQERVRRAQALIRSAFPVRVLRTVNVLYPYTTFEGTVRYRKVPEYREILVRR